MDNLNKEISKLPNNDKFIDYKPHITIAFLLPGKGKKYINDNFKGVAKPYKLLYSKSNGDKIYINI